MSDNYEFKLKLLNTGLFKRVSSDGWYRTKYCPYCGDSNKHMYLKISLNDESPVGVNCFKCNHKGLIDKTFLDSLGLNDVDIPKFKSKKKLQNEISDNVNTNIELLSQNDDISGIQQYIQDRIGVIPTFNELQMFQYIYNPINYINQISDKKININGFKNRYWFKLTNGNLSGRYHDDTSERWKKCNIFGNANIGLYVIRSGFNPEKEINVSISEGVFDAIGLYYHSNINNCIFISVQGKSYYSGIEYLIEKGIFGKSVSVGIYKDADVKTSDIKIYTEYRELFKNISIYENVIQKDYGYTKDQIKIQKINMLKGSM